VWRELYGAEPEAVPPYTPDWSESSGEEAMLAGVRRHLAEVGRDDMRAGDILVFRMRPRSVAKHMGIVAGDRARWTLIHAYSGRAVVESPLGPGLLARIAGVFRLPSTEVTGRGD
jgi:NlpC/P60 family putative phage cell wall peptidase